MANPDLTSFSESYILEVAKQVDKGLCAFVPMDGGTPFFLPDYRNPNEPYTQTWRKTIRTLRENADGFFEVLPAEGKAVYWQMSLFLQKQLSSTAQRELSDALSTKNPFSAFRDAIATLNLQEAWDKFRFPHTLEHTIGAFNLRQPADVYKIYAFQPEFKDHAIWEE